MNQGTLDIKIVRVHRLPQNGPLKAFVDMSVNDVLVIKGLRIVQGQKGTFVSMPQEQGKDKRWYNIIHCLSKEFQRDISDKVMSAYNDQS